MKYTLVALFVSVSFIVGLGMKAEEIATSWAGGIGTESDPYQISSVEHINKLRADSKEGITYEGQYFVLTSDIRVYPHIDISEFEDPDIPYEDRWERIEEFNGHLDGQGHTISGMYGGSSYVYSLWDGDEVCFIYKLGGSISNLIIADSFIGCWIGDGTNNEVMLNNCVNYATTRYGFVLGEIAMLMNCGNYAKSYCNALGRGHVCNAINCYNFIAVR